MLVGIQAHHVASTISDWPANYGAWYVSQILDALTASPENSFSDVDETTGSSTIVPPMRRPRGRRGFDGGDDARDFSRQ